MKVFYTIHYWKVSNMKRVLLYLISRHSNSGNIHLYGLSINDTYTYYDWRKFFLQRSLINSSQSTKIQTDSGTGTNQDLVPTFSFLGVPSNMALAMNLLEKTTKILGPDHKLIFFLSWGHPSWLQSIKEQLTLASWWTGALCHPRLWDSGSQPVGRDLLESNDPLTRVN